MSDVERHRLINQVFNDVCDLDPNERKLALDRGCGDDHQLRAAVERLLAYDAVSEVLGDELEPFVLPANEGAERSPLPERIGCYRILRPLGSGGFGTVYLAQQEEPLKRRIALKVPRIELGSAEQRVRFEAERQALALLEHDGIAKLFEAGTTDEGYPYFAMEYVDGPPITEYCVARRMDPKARVALLIEVCKAVAHSHRRGIIHRDLKPANVLIAVEDEVARPKIIDFGIAKLTDLAATGALQLTLSGYLIGTPIYMSPEQLDGSGDVDTRTDVYALGVILYELLTGTTPVITSEFKTGGLNEVRHRVVNSDPDRPSDRLSSVRVVPSEGTTTDRWRQAIEGDLDWITMKALQRDRERRYQSADELALDLTRCLSDQPISARPPTTAYLLRKFARRHRLGLTAAAVIVLAVIVGGAGSVLGLIQARRAQHEASKQRMRAEDERGAARAINDFLTEGLLSAAAPEALGYEVTLRKALDVAAAKIGDRFRDQVIVDVSIQLALGRTYRRLGALDISAPFTEHGAKRAREELQFDDPLAGEALHELAELRRYQEKYEDALAYYEDALRRRNQRLGPDNAATLESELGICASLSELGRTDESERRLRPLHLRCNQSLGEDHRVSISVLRGLALLSLDRNQPEQAVAPLEQAYELARHALGEDDPLVQLLMNDRIVVANGTGNVAAIRRLTTVDQEHRARRFGQDHPIAVAGRIIAGTALSRAGDEKAAEPILRDLAARLRTFMGIGNAMAQQAEVHYAVHCERYQRFDEAITILTQLISDQEQSETLESEMGALALRKVIALMERVGRTDEAEEYRQKRAALLLQPPPR